MKPFKKPNFNKSEHSKALGRITPKIEMVTEL